MKGDYRYKSLKRDVGEAPFGLKNSIVGERERIKKSFDFLKFEQYFAERVHSAEDSHFPWAVAGE